MTARWVKLKLSAPIAKHLLECVDHHLSFDCDEEPIRATSLRYIRHALRTQIEAPEPAKLSTAQAKALKDLGAGSVELGESQVFELLHGSLVVGETPVTDEGCRMLAHPLIGGYWVKITDKGREFLKQIK